MPSRPAASGKPARKPAVKAAKKTASKSATGMSFDEVMAALEAAGSEQTRRTYGRHGVTIPMFGVSFATLKTLYKRIKVDHALALKLWDSGNFDARNLAVKIVEPARLSLAELDRWAASPTARMCGSYVAQVAAEGPHGEAAALRWLTADDESSRACGWRTVAALAMIDERLDDGWFRSRLKEIEPAIHTAPNAVREAMNYALIAIGCRGPALRKLASAAAVRIGPVEVDQGDTSCKTPVAIESIDKAWAYAEAKNAESPAAQERARESLRTRC